MTRRDGLVAIALCVVMGFAVGRLSKLSSPQLVARLNQAQTSQAMTQAENEALRDTNRALRQQLQTLTGDNQQLRQRLDTFNRAFSPQDSLVSVASLAMVSERDGAWRYQLALMGVGGRIIPGQLGMELAGTLKGLPFTVDLIEAARGDQHKGQDWLRFKIKNLERLSGRFYLPDGFVPQTLDLTVKIPGLPASLRHYAWHTLAPVGPVNR